VFYLLPEAGFFDIILDFSGDLTGDGDDLVVGSLALRDALVASATGDATQTLMSADDVTVLLVGVDVATVTNEWFLIG
jgi:hypothetical protein